MGVSPLDLSFENSHFTSYRFRLPYPKYISSGWPWIIPNTRVLLKPWPVFFVPTWRLWSKWKFPCRCRVGRKNLICQLISRHNIARKEKQKNFLQPPQHLVVLTKSAEACVFASANSHWLLMHSDWMQIKVTKIKKWELPAKIKEVEIPFENDEFFNKLKPKGNLNIYIFSNQ